MLERLRLDPVIGGDHQQREIDPAGTGQHRVHEALVTRHVDEAEHRFACKIALLDCERREQSATGAAFGQGPTLKRGPWQTGERE